MGESVTVPFAFERLHACIESVFRSIAFCSYPIFAQLKHVSAEGGNASYTGYRLTGFRRLSIN